MENMKSDFPVISIIVPVYNVEKYLPKCIDSILAQTLKDIEIILVDDGSPDNCGMICDRYAELDSRIVVIHKPNGGISSARNDGIAAARADIIGFVDSDDWVEPEMFEKLVSALEKNGSDIAICNVSYDYLDHSHPSSVIIENEKVYSRDDALRLLVEDRMIHNYVWDKIFRKSVLSVPFPEGKTFEDILVMIQWFANSNKLVTIPYVGYHYVQRASSYLHSSPTQFEKYISSLRSQLAFLKRNNLIPDYYDFAKRHIIKGLLSYSKKLVYETTDETELYTSLKEISDKLRGFQKEVNDIGLSKKHLKRFDNLLNHPRRFIRSMKFNRRFHLCKDYITNFGHKPERQCFD